MSIDYFIFNIDKKSRLWVSCKACTSWLQGIAYSSLNEEPTKLGKEFEQSFIEVFKDAHEGDIEAQAKAILSFCGESNVVLVGDNETYPDEFYDYTEYDLMSDGQIRRLSYS